MILRFVTGNKGKLSEARTHLERAGVRVRAAKATPVEPQATNLRDVAVAKAESVRGRVKVPYFVEDAGFFIPALNDFPGVFSAHAYDTIGCKGILRLLTTRHARSARFEAVVALVEGAGPPRIFEGVVMGRVPARQRGDQGFGFDPIFVPEGGRKTFAQMGAQAKNQVSHRARALDALASYFKRPNASRKR